MRAACSRGQPPATHLDLPRLLLMAILLMPLPAIAYLDLAEAHVRQMENGMTLIVLENHELPIVSVQMLYRVGARNETAGATGLAHFVEHMAFRDSENFPGTQLVSSIYAAGGEWHGYTWLDQTTYYATAPKENLDLLLRIEADRMARLEISGSDVVVERGAVITEMHSYENDPASVLHDNAMYLAFLAHPYRNNTIGWESDVSRISLEDVVAFYQQHYHPGNAVLAVVGDVTTSEVIQRVENHFSGLPGRPPTPPPHTIEPAQTGERRIRLQGDLQQKYFKVVYRAPAAGSPDYAAFLLAQEVLAGGSGVSFLQNDWGTTVRPGAPLADLPGELSTWFPPSAQEYVFVISGTVAPDASEKDTEAGLEQRIRDVQKWLALADDSAVAAVERARKRVQRELLFDLQTTEDAAHQLAFFHGLDALDALIGLPRAVAGTSTLEVAAVMARYLRSDGRNIAWYVPATASSQPAVSSIGRRKSVVETRITNAAVTREQPSPALVGVSTSPAITYLHNGLPVILQRSGLSPSIHFSLVTAPADFPAGIPVRTRQPAWGLNSLDYQLLRGELGDVIIQARRALQSASSFSGSGRAGSGDPEAELERQFDELLGLHSSQQTRKPAPQLLVITGDFDREAVLQQVESGFGDLDYEMYPAPPALENPPVTEVESVLPSAFAQVRLGYLVKAPGPADEASAAWQMALYILSHHYEGRLGAEAISERGLIYHVTSGYNSDGRHGWITLSMGVDPARLAAMKQLLRETLDGLVQRPPSPAEVNEARSHLLGRYLSAAQSNIELADRLARDWFWYGQPSSYKGLQRRLEAITRQDIIDLVPAFVSGTIVSVINPPALEDTP